MKITTTVCFCTNDMPSGNPAAVVEEFGGDEHAMQQLATQLNFPVTVFVISSAGHFLLRFFYPTREMPLCIHGALSAGFVLLAKTKLAQFEVITKNNQKLIIKKLNNIVQLEINSGAVLSLKFSLNDINKMLRINYLDQCHADFPNCVATIGSPKLLVPIRDYTMLANIKPDFSYLKEWSISNNINGLYVYTQDTRDKNYDFIARGFNPKGGDNEDAATGTAAGALYTALNYHDKVIKITQGQFVDKPSCIVVSNENNHILIGGIVRFV